jgi:hypothetical protein
MDTKAMAITLKSLKLHGMPQAVDELDAQGSPAYQMKIVRFPAYRDLQGFDFIQSALNEGPLPAGRFAAL